MAFAAELEGHASEAQFWRLLPKTLETLKASLPESCTQKSAEDVVFTDAPSGLAVYRKSEDRAR